ncbi:salicylate hydroxylase [Moniliophthora roreri]|nr:salicylate hydroxylase [Moniliophthora roreri]
MANSSRKDFTVAIVGGGICGAVAAHGLSRAGVPVQVFESASKFSEVGAGIGIGPNALRALDGLGLLKAVISHSDHAEPTMRVFKFVSGSGSHEVVFDYEASMEHPEKLQGVGIYRPAFLDAVVEQLDPSMIHFHKRCTSVSSENGRSVVRFTDGTIHEADIVIGADGIHSATRHFVVGNDAPEPLAFTNTAAFRGLVPYEDLVRAGIKTELSERPVCFIGQGKVGRSSGILSENANKLANSTSFATPLAMDDCAVTDAQRDVSGRYQTLSDAIRQIRGNLTRT